MVSAELRERLSDALINELLVGLRRSRRSSGRLLAGLTKR